MKKKIFLHIGLHKTGSTFIQSQFFKKLNDEDKNLKVFIKDTDLEFHNLFTKSLNDKRHTLKIHQKIDEIKENKLIISGEGIFGDQCNSFSDKEQRFSLLEECFRSPYYIIVYREPSAFLYSAYNQRIRKGFNKSFKEFTHNETDEVIKKYKNYLNRNQWITNFKTIDFNDLFKDYLNIKERVLFLDFDELKNNKENFIEKINLFIDLKEVNIDTKKVNPSLKHMNYLPLLNRYMIFKILKSIIFKINILTSNHSKNWGNNFFIKNLILIYIKILKTIKSKKLEKYILEEFQTKKIIFDYHQKTFNEFKKKINY